MNDDYTKIAYWCHDEYYYYNYYCYCSRQYTTRVCISLLFLTFPVPPIIEPFHFQEGLSEGMRTRTVCGVSAGDPPLTISWLKDGQSPFPLPAKLASVVNVSQLDAYSSLLSISNLAAEHSGDYTCVAANPAAEVRYTAKLQVKGN